MVKVTVKTDKPRTRSRTPRPKQPQRQRQQHKPAARRTPRAHNRPRPKARPTPRRNPARSPAHAVAEMFSLPHLAPAVRLSTGYTGVPTAVASPFSITQLDWTATREYTENTSPVPDGQTLVALSRSPLTSLIRYDNNPLGHVYQYDAQFTTIDNGNPVGIGRESFHSEVTSAPQPLQIQYLIPDEAHTFTPHGERFFAVDIGEFKAMWQDGTTDRPVRFDLTLVAGSPGNEALRFSIQKWEETAWYNIGSTAVAAGWSDGSVLSINVSSAGYVRPTIECTAGTQIALTLKLDVTGNGGVFATSPLPHWETTEAAVDTIRVSATSIMITPNAPKLYTGGQCSGLQLPNGKSWHTVCDHGDPYSHISSDMNSTTMTFDNGLFGFMKPTGPADFDLQEPVIERDDVVVGYRNPVHPPGGWLVAAVMVSKVESSYPGGLSHVTACYACEFQTLSPWFEVFPPTIEVNTFEHALRLTSRMQQWHANSFHIGDILKFIYSGARKVLSAAPSIASAVSTIAPQYAPIANLIGSVAGKIGGVLPSV